MRTGACTVQQTLTSEAASVLKHSVSLARRRGHAQVTPLHVAATLLTSRVSLLRRACLKSHPHSLSHPLQSRALELCFNVALNRLPTTPNPILVHSPPSLSNALIAALKRAQAHQRRGCIDQQQQQQPLLAIKVELEQLIISILDDPSVSRVMREAGFSSTCVKNNLEDTSTSSSIMFYTSGANNDGEWQKPLLFPTEKMESFFSESNKDDLSLVVEVMLRKKRRNTVLVGDSLSSTERLVSRLMEKMERGDVPEELKSVHFIKFTLSSFSLSFMKREDVEMKVADLRRRVGCLVSTGGATIYVGDLKWIVDQEGKVTNYSPVDHIVAEIGRLVSDFNSFNSKVWLLGIANYQTYMRCQMRTTPLETEWFLHAVSVPSGGLGLSLHSPSCANSKTMFSLSSPQTLDSTLNTTQEEEYKLSCCGECTVNYEKEVGLFMSGRLRSLPFNQYSSERTKETERRSSSHLPHWMNPLKTEKCHSEILLELRRKWNRLCQSIHHSNRQTNGSHLHQHSHQTPYYPWWSAIMRFGHSTNLNSSDSKTAPQSNSNVGLLAELRKPFQPLEQKEAKVTLQLGNTLFSNCTTISELKSVKMGVEDLCRLLQENLPWQSEKIPLISDALVDENNKKKWLLIEGNDWIAKKRLALAIAESVFGSPDKLVHINLKRISKKMGSSCVSEYLTGTLKKEQNCVVLLEEIDHADSDLMKMLAEVYEQDKIEERSGVVIVTTSENTNSDENQEIPNSVRQMKLTLEECVYSPATSEKRKADWDSPNKPKQRKIGEERTPTPSSIRSFNTLDLNITAEGDFDEIHSNTSEQRAAVPQGFLQSIGNRLVLDSNPTHFCQYQENLRARMEAAASEACGEGGFQMDEKVLEDLGKASAQFLSCHFEKWLKEVFQTSLESLKKKGGGGKEGIVRLSSRGEEEGLSIGFMGSSLPTRIEIICNVSKDSSN